jgi:hypothetical protein
VNHGTLYAGTIFSSAAFRSTNGGASWQAISNGLTSTTVFAIAIDPATPSTLYLGSSFGHGIFKSTDSGDHWGPLDLGEAKFDVTSLAIDPARPATIYAGVVGASFGVVRSTDSGATWHEFGGGLSTLTSGTSVSALAISPTVPLTVFAGTGSGVFHLQEPGCGNGVVEAGEQCDNGITAGSCCTSSCSFAPIGTVCRYRRVPGRWARAGLPYDHDEQHDDEHQRREPDDEHEHGEHEHPKHDDEHHDVAVRGRATQLRRR